MWEADPTKTTKDFCVLINRIASFATPAQDRCANL